jgi:hypothetical protein
MAKIVLILSFILFIVGCGTRENITSNNYKFFSPPPSKNNGVGPKFGYVGGGYYMPTTGFFFRDVSFGMTEDEVEKIIISTNETREGQHENNLNMGAANVVFPTLSSSGKIVRHDGYIDLIITDNCGTVGVISFMFADGKLNAIFAKHFFLLSRPLAQNRFYGELLDVFSSISHSTAYNIKIVGSNNVYERDGIYHIFTYECSAVWNTSYKMTLEKVKFEGSRLQSAYGIKYKEQNTTTKHKKYSQEDNLSMPSSVEEKLKVYGRTVETLLN